MTTAVLPYSVQHYNSLPDIEDAGNNLKPEDISLLTTAIGQVFIGHKVQKLFGLTLLYNNFPLDEDEMLVNTGDVSIPWKTSGLDAKLRVVKGSAWRFTEQGLFPYEFAFDGTRRADINSFQPFLSELGDLLKCLGLMEKFGVCSLTNGDINSAPKVESPQGRDSVTVPFDAAPGDGPDRLIETVWQFDLAPELGSETLDETTLSPLVLKKCKVACNIGPNPGH
ncbi:hypothetical protein F5B20DRAFT_593843 [Whalleya microplaca]|nr:hypothetical protein F5B20DRAFT_593843 [Whalleya microplaca]